MLDADRAQVDGLIAVTAVLTSISGWDDGMIIVATLISIVYFIMLLISKQHKLGYEMKMLTVENMVALLKATYAVEFVYYTIVYTIKASIVFMYLRFAVSKIFRQLCYGTLVLLTVFYVVCVAGVLAQCRPIHKVWDITGLVAGTCINTTAFFYFTSGFNIITDVWIILLPIPTLRSIQITHREKVVLYFVFGIGAFSTALSCVRLQSIYTYTLATDPFHDGVWVNLWSIIEVNSAIVCATIPALKPLFKPRRLLESVRGGNKSNMGYERHGKEQRGGAVSRSPGSSESASGIIASEDRHVSESSIGMEELPEAYLRV
ncbi:hypothetical protein JX265_010279 [Neoarthrinium moseri]|uniref:Rhodopsin domain-containing protein n=1 Tax=Neoarthrinium moseri TaxID=1658444 RepID=A0A9P9WEQ5_9PEZI|nr:uncharacterized protein JN550_003522 [Neoarthrinium moseri]KAI1844222.1 hypothetical protein JX266_009513 [Neoarthrinium moseri]KAI1859830.1 hypothetical protein JX265_010279 [Neoarthrinium moseri]KAI1873269.1 hypothetical protein JN550_003522 [Neoarthrinium moseri]